MPGHAAIMSLRPRNQILYETFRYRFNWRRYFYRAEMRLTYSKNYSHAHKFFSWNSPQTVFTSLSRSLLFIQFSWTGILIPKHIEVITYIFVKFTHEYWNLLKYFVQIEHLTFKYRGQFWWWSIRSGIDSSWLDTRPRLFKQIHQRNINTETSFRCIFKSRYFINKVYEFIHQKSNRIENFRVWTTNGIIPRFVCQCVRLFLLVHQQCWF